MMSKFTLPISSGLVTALVLSGCGGGGDSTGPDEVTAPVVNAYQISRAPLKPVNGQTFATYLKNGLYYQQVAPFQQCSNCQSAPTTGDGAASGTDNSQDFSQTVTQDQGVDEADRIKYDGQHLFVAARPYYDLQPEDSPWPGSDYIKVLKRDEEGGMAELNTVALPDEFDVISGLYHLDNTLAAVGSSGYWYGIEPVADIWHPQDQKVNVAIYDSHNPSAMDLSLSLSFDGYLLSSRRVGDVLYLASSFMPQAPIVGADASTEAGKQSIYDSLQQKSISALMPQMSIDGVASGMLVSPDNCYLPEDATAKDGYNSMVTLTAINLKSPSSIQSVCIGAVVQDLYASTEHLYLMGTDSDQQSFIHQFALDSAINYQGTADIDGGFGWRNASLRLSEHNNRLGVVTTKWQDDTWLHQLYVLDAEPQGQALTVLGHLPNDARPEAIGKPGEDIYAVRYFADKAYVVTFQQIDPLYVMDLSDSSDPFIAGELEVPGFSSYLHPLNENLLLGVGQHVDPAQLPDNGQGNTLPGNPVAEGAKVALFDVSNPANPTMVGDVVYTAGFSPVEWDYHALTWLPLTEQQFRFALPVSFWLQEEGVDYWQPKDTLQLLEVNVTEGLGETGAKRRAGWQYSQ